MTNNNEIKEKVLEEFDCKDMEELKDNHFIGYTNKEIFWAWEQTEKLDECETSSLMGFALNIRQQTTKKIFDDIENNCPIDRKWQGYDIDGILELKKKWVK